ncbi:M42 family metallopeptidase [Candidatus Pyrohabitans sp.]
MKLLKKLSEAHGVPGNEEKVRQLLREELAKVCDEVYVDKLGNLIARKGEGKRRVMLDAHMDEIGLVVKHIDKKGFIRFTTLGGFFDQTLLNQRVVVHTRKGELLGVIGSKPPHLMKEKERKKVIKAEDMFIDVGAGDGDEVKKQGVRVGDYITFDRSFSRLGGSLVTGKAFDNRIGCYAMVEVMRRLCVDAEVYAVATVQEEVGLKGARTAAYRIYPDLAIVLDVTTTGDYPGVREEESATKLNAGPAITLVDAKGRGLITHPDVKELLISTAEEEKIPYQLEVGEGGTTDATTIHLTKEGILAGVVTVPTRYIHSPVEVASTKDIERVVELVTKAVEKWAR